MSTVLNEVMSRSGDRSRQLLAGHQHLLEEVLDDLLILGSVTASRVMADTLEFDLCLFPGTKMRRVVLLVDSIAEFMGATAGTATPINETEITIRLLMQPYIYLAPG